MKDQNIRVDSPVMLPKSRVERDVYRELYALGDPAEFDADKVEQAIAPYPAIADRLLRVANSMRHGTLHQIISLHHAIVMIGAKGVREFSEPIVNTSDGSRSRNSRLFGRGQLRTESYKRDSNDY